jgi:hypothetical protein
MSRDRYNDVVAQTWRHTIGTPSDKSALLRDLVRNATLAPSSHNTQCWKFPLFDAIPRRQCVRADYDGKMVPLEYLAGTVRNGGATIRVGRDSILKKAELRPQRHSFGL